MDNSAATPLKNLFSSVDVYGLISLLADIYPGVEREMPLPISVLIFVP